MRLPLLVGRIIFRSFGVWESVVLSILLRPESRRTRLNTQLQWLKQIKRPKLTGASCWRSGRSLDHDAPVRQLAWVWIFWSNSNVNLNLLHWNYFFILFLDVYSLQFSCILFLLFHLFLSVLSFQLATCGGFIPSPANPETRLVTMFFVLNLQMRWSLLLGLWQAVLNSLSWPRIFRVGWTDMVGKSKSDVLLLGHTN